MSNICCASFVSHQARVICPIYANSMLYLIELPERRKEKTFKKGNKLSCGFTNKIMIAIKGRKQKNRIKIYCYFSLLAKQNNFKMSFLMMCIDKYMILLKEY